MYKYLKKEYVLPALLIILLFPLFFSLLRPGFFSMQDDLQAFRIQQMVKCLKDLQIPCRWIPDMGYQYGYPQFNFYPPSVFYLGGVLNMLGIQVIDTVKLLFILGFILSAITMFIYLKSLLGEWSAFIGSVLYSIVPYKATEVYVRGSLSEFWSFVFFPLIFWSSSLFIKSGKFKYLLWLAISLSLLFITHNLMSFIFLPIYLIWVLTITILLNKWKILPKIILGSVLGLGLSAFFILPVIFEGKFVHLETLTGGYFDYRQHFVNLYQLFFSNHFGYGSSYLGPNDDLSLSVGQVHWVLGLAALIIGLIYFHKMRKIAIISFVLAGVELAVLFLMHQKSSFIWEKLPMLVWLQFPWRFLADSAFILSILGAITIYGISLVKRNWGIIAGIAVIAVLFLLHASFFQPKDWLNISDQDKFSGNSWEKELTISIFDYLPIYAKLPPNKKAPDLPETLSGEVEFLSYQKGSNYQKGEIKVKKEAVIRLPLFDFPGMEVFVDGQRTKFWHNDCQKQEYCLGLITLSIQEGEHVIKAQLSDTPVRRTANIISITSVLVLAAVFFQSRKNEKHLT